MSGCGWSRSVAGFRLCVAGVVQPEGVQLVVEGGLAESQQLGGLALVAAGLPQGAQDALLFLGLPLQGEGGGFRLLLLFPQGLLPFHQPVVRLYGVGTAAAHEASYAVVLQPQPVGDGAERLGGRLVQAYRLAVFLHAAGEDLTAVRQPRHAQTGGKLRLMLPHILAERLGMQPELPGHLRSGASGLFQAGYGAGILRGGGFQVLLRAGEVDGLPLAALVPAVLHDQPAVPYPQVVAQAGHGDARSLRYLTVRQGGVAVEPQGLAVLLRLSGLRLVAGAVARQRVPHLGPRLRPLALVGTLAHEVLVVEQQVLPKSGIR